MAGDGDDMVTPETPEGLRFKWAMEGLPAMLEWLAGIQRAMAEPVVVPGRRRRKPRNSGQDTTT